MSVGIYKITSPSGRIYIGQSVNVQKRIKQYKRKECKGQRKLNNSFNKYGIDTHVFEIIEICEIEELNKRERYWQDFYKCLHKGLNCRLTSTDVLPSYMSKKTREKISISLIGHPVSERTKEISSKTNKGNTYCLGYKHTEDFLNTLRKKILQYTLDLDFIKEWSSIKEAAESIKNTNSMIKSKSSNIGNCLKGLSKSAYGFKWKYK